MDGVDAHTIAQGIEESIAGLIYGLLQIRMAVAAADCGAKGIIAPPVRNPWQSEIARIFNSEFIVYQAIMETT